MTDKNLPYYQALPYTRRCEPVEQPDEPGGRYWLAWIEELSGCKTDGSSDVEAMQHLDEVFDEYITAKLKWGSEIPEPRAGARRTAAPPPLEVRVHREEPQTCMSLPADADMGAGTSRSVLLAAGSC